ncbi:MAG: CCA tRNA nucleotidyltransferase [Proteobacteria bacterium]|nr:CCA tRNA nucleotidyltransferase [Pseudomonadota bacterium]
MTIKIEPQAWMTAPATRRVLDALTAHGQVVRFVGGCVRDAIIGREIRDIDLATPDDPQSVTELLAAAHITAIPTGIQHGTITAVVAGHHFEITSLRRDVETFGRRARVEFTADWLADAGRRDFTINALYCDPDGTLFDPTGGCADLGAGLIRFVGDPNERIREDFLRILRYFRFLAWYGQSPPDRNAIAACTHLAPEMVGLSGERVAAELFRLLAAPNPAPVVEIMVRQGVIKAVTPELFSVDRLRSLCVFEDAVAKADQVRRMSALCTRDSEAARALTGRLRLSTVRGKRLMRNAAGSALIATDMGLRAMRLALYRLGLEAFEDLILLAFADADTAGQNIENARVLLAAAAAWPVPVLPVGGHDLIARGVPEGPELGRRLDELEQWWVENDFVPGRTALLVRCGEPGPG